MKMHQTIDTVIFDKLVASSDMLIGSNNSILSVKNIKRIIKTRELKRDHFFWDNGALVWGISSLPTSVPTPYYDALRRKPPKVSLVDDILYFYATYNNLSLVEKEEAVAFLKSHPQDEMGSLMYRKDTSYVFIDSIGMVCPFLARYGVENHDVESVDMALNQFRAFFKQCIDEESGLPYHGYDSVSGTKMGIIGWGRALGWLMIGLSEAYSWLGEDAKMQPGLDDYIEKIVTALLRYQRQDGGFSWQLQAMDGPLDTSATSMIGYALLRLRATSARGGDLISETAVFSAAQCVLSSMSSTGAILGSSAECKGFSMYPQHFGQNSWGQGFGTLFLANVLMEQEKGE